MRTQSSNTRAILAAFAAALVAAAAPAITRGSTPQPPARPATATATPSSISATVPALQTKFESGEPIAGYFTALALRFHVIVIEPKPVKAYLLKNFELPSKLEDAIDLARQTLEAQGFTVLQSGAESGIVLRIVTAKEAQVAQQAEGPVSFGREPEKVNTSNPTRQVTHIMPIVHPDIITTLKRNATSDPDVAAEEMGNAASGMNLMIMGPALKVQKVVANLAKMDAEEEKPTLVGRTLALKRLNAAETAQRLNADFARDGLNLKATAEPRTNALIVTGLEEQVLKVMLDVTTMELSRQPGEEEPLPPPALRPSPRYQDPLPQR